MDKCKTIGVMTGNSMDAIDIVLTEFSDDDFCDICSASEPYSAEQKCRIDNLRHRVIEKKLDAKTLLNDNDFQQIHQEYVSQIAEVINHMCAENHINKSSIKAIGFHGKTLDYNPPSVAKENNEFPFTTQMGSAQLLANLTNIPTINDFRSELIMQGFEGAPLAPPHNARISEKEGNGCYINAGNTSNLAWVKNGFAQIGWDAGAFNEYIDGFILRYKGLTMDKDAVFGKKGKLLTELVEMLFSECKEYYDLLPPKSGDPSYYQKDIIFSKIEKMYGNPNEDTQLFCNIIHTLEYFASYIVAYSLGQTPHNIEMISRLILFGGGWRNPICKDYLSKILKGETHILAQHKKHFADLNERLTAKPEIYYSKYGTYMEARLFADLAYCRIKNKSWRLPELVNAKKELVLGKIRYPFAKEIDDSLSQATRGWQQGV